MYWFFSRRNIHDDSMPNIVLRVTANIVFGYATYVLLSLRAAPSVYLWKSIFWFWLCVFCVGLQRCQDAEAFELSSSGFANGVFVKFLKKRLLDDEKITVVLDRVAEGGSSEDSTWSSRSLYYFWYEPKAVRSVMLWLFMRSMIFSRERFRNSLTLIEFVQVNSLFSHNI